MPGSQGQTLDELSLPLPAPCDGDPAPTPSLAVHALNRLAYGPLPTDVARVESIGYDAYLAEQLDYLSIPDGSCDALLAQLPNATLSESWAQLYDRRNMGFTEASRPVNEVRHAHFTKMAWSNRQLYERTVEFWYDHFNIYGFENIVRSLWPKWDQTLRTHAFGNFRAMLEATAAHPCMLYYLDNYLSTDGGPNENYARELFELHSLGAINYLVPGGYIDQDVYESSRCFTGWTIDQDNSSPGRGQFLYIAENHDRFIKFVLNTVISGDQTALKDGRDVLDLIVNNFGTSRYLAEKLCRRFISDNPPSSIVESTAQVFHSLRADPNQIRSTLFHILNSAEFRDPSIRMGKFKRPIDWMVSTMRALGMAYSTDGTFDFIYGVLGQPIYAWRTPDGAPDTKEFWISSNALMQRWNLIYRVASDWYTGDEIDFNENVMPADRRTARQMAEFWANRVCGRQLSSSSMDALTLFVAEGRGADSPLSQSQIDSKTRYVASVACMTPEFQRR